MKIGAIIVLYEPEIELVDKAINTLIPQTDIVCLIDNSNVSHADHFAGNEHIHYIPLLKNHGIAAAQNIGIKYLKEINMDFVLFSDQDSLCDKGLVKKIAETYILLEDKGYSVGALGPVPVNKKTGKPYIYKQNIIQKFKLSSESEGELNLCQMYSIISSFSFIRIKTFDIVGLFEEDLFIDGIDNEWGWRAMNKYGLNSYIIQDLHIQHFQGVDTKLPIKKSTPFRSYYQFRNFIILSKRRYTPTFWKKTNAMKFFIKAFSYPILFSPHWKFLINILKGCYDGILSRYSGKPI